MIARRVKLQVLAFVLMALVGVSFVGLRYVGLGDAALDRTYVVQADFAASGGIFTNASVTYRGVQVGRVGQLRLVPDGVRVELRLDSDTRVPAGTRAVVANRSAVGEQYVDLRPDTGSGPYLHEGSVIPRSRTSGPLAVEVVLLHLDELVNSVDRQDLEIVIDELGKAFNDTGPALQRMIDGGNALLAEATESLPETIALIRQSRTVLDTQVSSASAIRAWARSLAELSAQLRASDADLRRLLVNAPPASAELVSLLRGLRPSLGVLLGNLITGGQVTAARIDGVQQILATYPDVVAGTYTVVPGDGTSHFGLVMNFDDPPPCVYGKRSTTYACSQAERQRGSAVRGWQNAPRGGQQPGPAPMGPPAPGEPAGDPGYDPATGLVLAPDGTPLLFGSTGGHYRVLGEQSFKALLLGPLTA